MGQTSHSFNYYFIIKTCYSLYNKNLTKGTCIKFYFQIKVLFIFRFKNNHKTRKLLTQTYLFLQKRYVLKVDRLIDSNTCSFHSLIVLLTLKKYCNKVHYMLCIYWFTCVNSFQQYIALDVTKIFCLDFFNHLLLFSLELVHIMEYAILLVLSFLAHYGN